MSKITVVKFGGSLSRNVNARKKFIRELSILHSTNPVVLVHGGGPEIAIWLKKAGIVSKFVNGLRYTDIDTLEIVEMVLSGKVNKGLVAEFIKNGKSAVGISGKDGKMVTCVRKKGLGFVGEPKKVDVKVINTLLNNGFIPVISSLALGKGGLTLNVNADTLAMAIAGALKAESLILLTDVCGVLDSKGKTIERIKLGQINNLISTGVVTGGMIPKLRACAKAIKGGAKRVCIADGRAGLNKMNGTVITL